MRLSRIGSFRRPTVCRPPPPGGYGIAYVLTLLGLNRIGTGMDLGYVVTWDGIGPAMPKATLYIVAPTFVDHILTASDGASHTYQKQPADQSKQQTWTVWLQQGGNYGHKQTITSVP